MHRVRAEDMQLKYVMLCAGASEVTPSSAEEFLTTSLREALDAPDPQRNGYPSLLYERRDADGYHYGFNVAAGATSNYSFVGKYFACNGRISNGCCYPAFVTLMHCFDI